MESYEVILFFETLFFSWVFMEYLKPKQIKRDLLGSYSSCLKAVGLQ